MDLFAAFGGLRGTERVKAAQRHVSARGVLLDGVGELAGQFGQADDPVGQEQHRSTLALVELVAKHDGDAQPGRKQELEAVHNHRGAHESDAGADAGPEQDVVLSF